MALHESAFSYLNPTDAQKDTMNIVRGEFMKFVFSVDQFIPDGPDKTYLMRRLRDCAMWANVAITRNPDGSPRIEPVNTGAPPETKGSDRDRAQRQ